MSVISEQEFGTVIGAAEGVKSIAICDTQAVTAEGEQLSACF